MKRDILDIDLTTFFGVRKFKNTQEYTRVIFFLEMFKIESNFAKCKKKKENWEKAFFSEIISSEDIGINCLY